MVHEKDNRRIHIPIRVHLAHKQSRHLQLLLWPAIEYLSVV